jgi:hypothetical protein
MPRARAVTMDLEAVAKRAPVSTSTVSRVLKKLEVVKSSTRARMIKATEEPKEPKEKDACGAPRNCILYATQEFDRICPNPGHITAAFPRFAVLAS